MKRTTLPQPTRRPLSAVGPTSSPTTRPIVGRTVIEVTSGQLAGLRGLVVEVSQDRWSIKLDGAAPGVLLSIAPRWVRVISSSGR